MSIVISGDSGISPVTPSGTSALVDGMTVGRGAGEVSTNTAVGASALAATNSGGYTTGFGYAALTANTSGTQNTAVGANAAPFNTTGSYNAVLGTIALFSNSTGSYNTAIGNSALYSNTTASNNTAVGYQAGYSNTTGAANTSVGFQAGYSFTTGVQNTSVGNEAGVSATSDGNSFFGRRSGYNVTTGGYNTMLGYGAGYWITTGAKNTIIGGYGGNSGGLDIRTSSNNIVLSDGDGNPRGWFDSNGTFLINTTSRLLNGYLSVYNGSDNAIVGKCGSNSNAPFAGLSSAGSLTFYVLGSGNIYSTSTSITAISDISQKENIVEIPYGLSTVQKLQPVQFDFKEGCGSEEKGLLGFIAQDVEKVIPELVNTNMDDLKTLKMGDMLPILVKAIQELKAEFDAYKEAHP